MGALSSRERVYQPRRLPSSFVKAMDTTIFFLSFPRLTTRDIESAVQFEENAQVQAVS